MARGGLGKWFNENWVDIGRPKKEAVITNVEDAKQRKVAKDTQNVCQLQKRQE